MRALIFYSQLMVAVSWFNCFLPVSLYGQDLCLVNPELANNQLVDAYSTFAQWTPVAVSKISAKPEYQCIAEQIQLSVLKILHSRQVATVEVDDQALDEVLGNLEFQSSPMVNQDTTVTIGDWVAAKYLLRGSLHKKPTKDVIYYRYSLLNLQTRLQEADNCIIFQVQDCLFQSELLNLPSPSRGGGIDLPAPEKRY